jgi:hypothetical protein
MKLNEFEYLNCSKHNIILIYYSNKNNRNGLVPTFFHSRLKIMNYDLLKAFLNINKNFQYDSKNYCKYDLSVVLFHSKSLTKNDDHEKKIFRIFNEHRKVYENCIANLNHQKYI